MSAKYLDIVYPLDKAIFQHANLSADIPVSATVNSLPVGNSVEYVLDMGTSNEISVIDNIAPYEHIFQSVKAGEHTLDIFIIDPNGQRTDDYVHRNRIGVGDIIVAMGDSITAGEDDDILTDNWSSDGRVGPYVYLNGPEYGGFEPILTDCLTSIKGYPVVVVKEGIPGALSSAAVTRIGSILRKYPNARTWILAYGTNDSNHNISSSTYKNNLIYTINQIKSAIPQAVIYIPKIFYWTSGLVTKYHQSINDIVNSNPGVYWGADLDSLFRANHAQFNHLTGQAGTWFSTANTHHPNGIGVQKMAVLWKLALVDGVTLVTDGSVSSIGGTWTDDILIEGVNTVGLNKDNLLLIRKLKQVIPPAPGGTMLYGKFWEFMLSNSDTDFAGGSLKVTMRLENNLLPPVGAVSWKQFWIAHNTTILDTTRIVDPVSTNCQDLSALVNKKGRISSVVDLEAPVTKLTVEPGAPDGRNGWYRNPPKISLAGSDTTGMPISIKYKWDSGSEYTYAGPLYAPQGEHTLSYYSVDQSANNENVKSMVFKVGESGIVPENISISPNSGTIQSGVETIFTTVYDDANGYKDIRLACLLVNYTLNGSKCAYIKYDAGNNCLYLRDDANTIWLGGYPAGSSNIIENSYCRIDCAKTTISGSGPTLTIKWCVTIKPALIGSNQAYLNVSDYGRLKDSWENMGSYTIK
ncbi:MAG: SGNH/GDSL hydrolase family protein [Armatimonadota bacterium]